MPSIIRVRAIWIGAARAMADEGLREAGAAPGLVMYTSEHAHSSVEKGGLALGIGQKNIRKIGVDSSYRMRPDLLAAAIAGETHEYTDMYPGMAKTARQEGFDEIADWFETLAKAERSHANRFQKALDAISSGETLQADIDDGAPVNTDGTVNLVHYAAWLVREVQAK